MAGDVKKRSPHFVIVGGGLAGALMANYLGKAGFETDVYEMRGDVRAGEIGGGRSINLALSYRGLCALERVGLKEEVLKQAIPMRGRMIHPLKGALHFQPYDKDPNQAINSVSRNGLNAILLEAASHYPTVRLHFHEKCTGVDLDRAAIELTNSQTAEHREICGDVVVSADGAFSAVRHAMQKRERFDYSQSYLAHGYKELTIPPGDNGKHRMEVNALHIWPRKSLMMIALPNADGSYTCTLFWPLEGRDSFASIRDEHDLTSFFTRQFPDAVPLMPTLVEDYFTNPVGALVTIRCAPWSADDRVVLLGDAAHAVVPFYGQGMNAAFEDVQVLDELMRRQEANRGRAFADFFALRKPDADALADLAIDNFVEMRDHTGSRLFWLKKKSEKWLYALFPKWYIPLYTLVSFTQTRYSEAVTRARRQNRVMSLIVVFALILAFLGIGVLLF